MTQENRPSALTRPIKEALRDERTQLSAKQLATLSQSGLAKRKQATLDGRTQQVDSARKSILLKVCKAQGNLRALTKDEQDFTLQDIDSSLTRIIKGALNDGDTQLSDKQLQTFGSRRSALSSIYPHKLLYPKRKISFKTF